MAKKSLGTILGELYKSFFITNPGLQMYTEAQLAQGRASEEAANALLDNIDIKNLTPGQITAIAKVFNFATRGNILTTAAISQIIKSQSDDFVAALQDPPTLDEIDAENEEEAAKAAEISKADSVSFQISKKRRLS